MSYQTKTKGEMVPDLQLGQKVINVANPAWGEGVVEATANRRGIVGVRWEGMPEGDLNYINELVLAPGGDTESLNLGEEEEMGKTYEIDQPVLDAGGMIGHVKGFENTETGSVVKVEWEDGRSTRHVPGALYPVETKAPTPKEVQQVAQIRKPVEDNLYEPIKVIEAWDLTYGLGNTVSLIAEAAKKDHSQELADLEQAAYFLNRRIESLKARTQKDVA